MADVEALQIEPNAPEGTAPSATNSTPKSDWGLTFDFAAIAFILRLSVTMLVVTEPVWDGFYYDLGARRIATGFGYSEELLVAGDHGEQKVITWFSSHYPIGFPAFLAACYRVLGRGLFVWPMVSALIGAMLVVVVHRLGLSMFSSSKGRRIRAAIAALLVAANPGLVLYSGALMTEPLASLLLLACVLFAATAVSTEKVGTRWLFWVASALTLGLASLVRPNALLLVPVVAIGALAMCKSWRSWLVFGATYCVCSLLPVLPWTIRNCAVMEGCALVSTNAGWNLVIGNMHEATGKFEYLVGHVPPGAPQCDSANQVVQDRCWSNYAMKLIAENPRRIVSLWPKKLHYTLDNEWAPINYLREARPDMVSERSKIFWGKITTFSWGLLLILAALGGVAIPPFLMRPKAVIAWLLQLTYIGALIYFLRYMTSIWPLGVVSAIMPLLPIPGWPKVRFAVAMLASLVLVMLFSHVLFFGEDRYHLALTPAYCLLAAAMFRRGV